MLLSLSQPDLPGDVADMHPLRALFNKVRFSCLFHVSTRLADWACSLAMWRLQRTVCCICRQPARAKGRSEVAKRDHEEIKGLSALGTRDARHSQDQRRLNTAKHLPSI